MANQSGGSVVWNLDAETGPLFAKLNAAKAAVKDTASAGVASANQISSSVSNAAGQIGNAFSKISGQFNQAAQGLGSVLKNVGVVTAAGTALGAVFVKSAADLQVAAQSFRVLIGNATEANTLFSKIKAFADSTPFQFPELANSAKLLLGYGANAEDTYNILTRLADAAASAGGNLQGITFAYAQMIGRGKVTGDNLRQLTENLVTLRAELSKVSGVPIQDLDLAVSNSEISINELNQALVLATSEGGKFFNGTAILAQTFSGRMSTLKDAVGEFGRNLVGVFVNTDPNNGPLGLSVKPGGIFDTLSRVIPTITANLQRIQPAVEGAFGFLARNGKTIVSIIAAIGAAYLFARGAAIAFALASFVTLNPVVAAITALVGLVTYLAIRFGILGNVVQNIQNAMDGVTGTSTLATDSMQELADTTGKDFPAAAGTASKSANDLADKLAKIDEQAKKATRDFQQSMAELVKTHQDKVNSIKAQLEDENKSFEQANADRLATFTDNKDKIEGDYQDQSKVIQDQIDHQVSLGSEGNQATIKNLQDNLAKMTKEYIEQTADNQKQYDKDTENAKIAHNKKLADYQTELDEETRLLEKHASDVASVRGTIVLDEFEKLQQSRQDQIESFAQQKEDAIKSAQETAAGVSDAYNSALLGMKGSTDLLKASITGPGGVNESFGFFSNFTLGKVKSSIGEVASNMAGVAVTFGLVAATIAAPLVMPAIIVGAALGAIASVKGALDELHRIVDQTNKDVAKLGDYDTEFFKSLRKARDEGRITQAEFLRRSTAYANERQRASGGPVSAGESYIVGENRDGSLNATSELFVPKTSGTIIPADQLQEMAYGGSTKKNVEINQTNHVYNNIDMIQGLRDLSWRLQN